MLGQQMQVVFNRVFVMMIINVYFLIYSLAGLIIFGIGPAFRAVSELYLDGGDDFRKYSFKRGFGYFKKYFVQANIHALSMILILGFLAYNFYLALQIKFGWMIVVEFLIIAAFILIYGIGIFTWLALTRFDISYKNALKLSVMQFFSNFGRLLLFVGLNIGLIFATAKWPGLILFLSFGIFVVLNTWISKDWFTKVDDMLAENERHQNN